jgi:glutaminyl-tRNA synthetase
MTESSASHKTNFIRNIIDADLAAGKHQDIVLRFPPEPNGYLHIGHAKSICLNFGLATDYQGVCHLRFDDTNPSKEEQEFIDAIQNDIRWLGFSWGDNLYHTSDYFEKLYQCAVSLIKAGKAYVDDLTAEQMREYRGNLTTPGKNSPNRDRDITESLALFEQMRAGECQAGQYTLRAKIDMAAGNINLRDPIIYRIMDTEHHSTADQWCIYPMYDFAHALSDAIENISHSLCTLEFQDHRPLYDWFVQHCPVSSTPRQIEFSRLNLNYTITSKRKLKQLVDQDIVDGWDDPRMPTLAGIRRRGYPPAAIRQFCQHVGISKTDSIIDVSILEEQVRSELNKTAERRMAVLEPIKVIITNFNEDEVQQLNVANHPQDESCGRRDIPFTREIFIDASDFMLDPPNKYFRLKPGGDVRLRNAYVITCDDVIQDAAGNVIELHCHYDPDTLGGKKPADGRKVKGVIHWVSAPQAVTAEVRCYDRLFTVENPGAEGDFTAAINPNACRVINNAKIEPSLAIAKPEDRFQFTRVGYFCADRYDHKPELPVFNMTVGLKDTWKKS